jgi:ketosteroid isomerase-like protein
MDRMVEGYESSDADVILGTYEPEAAYAVAPGQHVTGTTDLRGLFVQIIAAKPAFTFGTSEVVVAGDLALHLSRYDATLGGDGSPDAVHTGLSVAVLRRQPGGAWLMVIDHPAGHQVMQTPTS